MLSAPGARFRGIRGRQDRQRHAGPCLWASRRRDAEDPRPRPHLEDFVSYWGGRQVSTAALRQVRRFFFPFFVVGTNVHP